MSVAENTATFSIVTKNNELQDRNCNWYVGREAFYSLNETAPKDRDARQLWNPYDSEYQERAEPGAILL